MNFNQSLMRVSCSESDGGGYWCKENNNQTSFVKRGHPFSEEKKKEKDLVRQELARVRATAMEGSFGTQKEHSQGAMRSFFNQLMMALGQNYVFAFSQGRSSKRNEHRFGKMMLKKRRRKQ